MKVSVAYLAMSCLTLAPFALAGAGDTDTPSLFYKDEQGITRRRAAAANSATHQKKSVMDPSIAIPFVSNMKEFDEFKTIEASDEPRKLADSYENFVKDHKFSENEKMGLDSLFAKYEIPMGLTKKLFELQRFDALEFILDDSGSMESPTDMLGPNGEKLSRWQEQQHRMKEFLEILAYVPTKPIRICFLNRCQVLAFDRVQKPMSPEEFIQHTFTEIDEIFKQPPNHRTPYVQKIRDSLAQRGSIARYFFSDGQPTDYAYPDGPKGKLNHNFVEDAVKDITRMVKTRRDPQNNPITFLSCTDQDKDVEWMKQVEEKAPFCAELDDYEDEANEVLKDQGRGFPFSKGVYLIASLVGAINPHDLDAMDETIPFLKRTFEDITGMQLYAQDYQNYFERFQQAQKDAKNKALYENGYLDREERIKYNFNWSPHYRLFLTSSNRERIPAVKKYRRELNGGFLASLFSCFTG